MDYFTENCWHLYSDGKSADVPFGSNGLKVFAMNSIAILSHVTGVVIICVEINDTHLHVVGRSSPERALLFRNALRLRIIRFLKTNQKANLLGKGFYLACDFTTDRDEILRKIIYTFRNCLDCYDKAPWNYKWGVGNLYFSERRDHLPGRKLGDLSYREQFRLLHTKYKVPQEWEYDDDGMILPGCYIDYEFVEQLFGSPRAFLAFLFVKREDEQYMKQRMNTNYLESRSIDEMRARGERICKALFHKSLRTTSLSDRLKIASTMIAERSGSKSESLAKALFLKKEDLLRLL